MKKIILFLLFIFVFSCENEKEYLKIGTNVWPGYEPLYVAQELGYLKDIPVHIVEYSSATQVIRAYRNQIINGATLTLDEVLLLRSYGFEPVVVLVMDISNGADAVVAQPYIKSFTQLKNKKIGVENSALGAYMLTRFLEKTGLKVEEVNIVPLEIHKHYKWFKEKKIDAVVTFEPVKSKLVEIGGRVIFDSSQIPDEIVDVLVIENSYLQKNPQIVKKLINSWFKAVNKLKSGSEIAKKIVAEREKIDISQVENIYKGIEIPNKEENLRLLDEKEPKLLPVILKLFHIMEKENIIRNKIEISNILNGEFIN